MKVTNEHITCSEADGRWLVISDGLMQGTMQVLSSERGLKKALDRILERDGTELATRDRKAVAALYNALTLVDWEPNLLPEEFRS